MIVSIYYTIIFCWLASLVLGCAAPRPPFTTDGVAYQQPKNYSPAAAAVPTIENKTAPLPGAHGEGPAKEKLPDKESSLLAGAPQDANEKKETQKKEQNTPEEQATILQEATGPGADDELLDLWRKDMDKAMEQPAGQRKIRFSLPVQNNRRVLHFVDSFRGAQRSFFERALARSGRYVPPMAAILREEGLPENLVYLALIESGFSPYAYSRAKAMGPWQFIHGTALRYGLKIDSWVDERRDPVLSTRAAAAYLKDLHEMFGEWFLAAAAYNAGESRVGRALQRSKTNDFWDLTQEKKYLKLETRNYVPKFIAAAMVASAPEKYGFEEVAYETPLQYDEVTIHTPLRLETVAELANSDVNVIKAFNPALLRNFTPPNDDGFTLRLPVGSGETFSSGYQILPASAKIKLTLHKVKKGEALSSIARRYDQTPSRLMKENGLKSRRVRPGQELVIVRDGAVKRK